MNIIWFKRDLRCEDHAPYFEALKCGPSVGLFVFEDDWLRSAEFDLGHLRFVIESIENLREDLRKRGVPLLLRRGSALEVLSQLHHHHKISGIYSHEETGLDWSFRRDILVRKWTCAEGISWKEYRQFAVVRGLKDRDEWSQKRSEIIERPLFKSPGQNNVFSPWSLGDPPRELLTGYVGKPLALAGGRRQALEVIATFFSSRIENYVGSLSTPVKAFEGCSRLSPYIAWGNISLSEIQNQIAMKRQNLLRLDTPYSRSGLRNLEHFESRLWWHCHFIQKLETEPAIEFENFNREFDGMREAEFSSERFDAWCKGETGFPMIDASMRALIQHGWINFRMRALLMSFASYQLWLHWKPTAEFLARQFLDFEPGIHYSQAQMQSGVTGINTIRIYSPAKQAAEKDPTGEFIRRYVPELSQVPLSDLFEPYNMPPLLQIGSSLRLGRDYPVPIVDPENSYNAAKVRIFEWKDRPGVVRKSKDVYEKHGSRANKHFPSQKRN